MFSWRTLGQYYDVHAKLDPCIRIWKDYFVTLNILSFATHQIRHFMPWWVSDKKSLLRCYDITTSLCNIKRIASWIKGIMYHWSAQKSISDRIIRSQIRLMWRFLWSKGLGQLHDWSIAWMTEWLAMWCSDRSIAWQGIPHITGSYLFTSSSNLGRFLTETKTGLS